MHTRLCQEARLCVPARSHKPSFDMTGLVSCYREDLIEPPFSASTSVLDNPCRKIFLCLADESYLPLSDKPGEVKV